MTHNKDVEYNAIVVPLMETFMFKKLICMTALSFALASSPEAYAAGKCGITNLVINSYGNFTGNVDPLKCNVSKFNNTKNLYLGNEDQAFNKFSLAIGIIENILGGLYPAFRDTILEKCGSNEFVEYIRRRSENAIRNKITKCIWEKCLLNKWVILGTSLLATLSFIGGWYGTALCLIPSAFLGNLRLVTDLCYVCSYIWPHMCCYKCISDFSYAKCLFDPRLIQNIDQNDIISEREYLFKHLSRRGYIVELVNKVGYESFLKVIKARNITKEHIRALFHKGQMSLEDLKCNGKGISDEQIANAGINIGNNNIENNNNENNNYEINNNKNEDVIINVKNDNSRNVIINNNKSNDKNNFHILNVKKNEVK